MTRIIAKTNHTKGIVNNPTEIFEHLDLFTTWDDWYYSPPFQKFYNLAIDYIIDKFMIRASETILDAGCGPGVHTIRWLQRGFNCISIDFSKTVLQEAEIRIKKAGFLKRAKLKQEDLTKLSFPDNQFPWIFCWGVLMHIPKPEKAIDELSRVLKPGGSIAISTTNANSFDHFLMHRILYKIKKPKSLKTSGESSMGRYCIYDGPKGELFVQGLFMNEVKKRFERNGLQVTHHVGSEISELYTLFSSTFIRRVFAYLNLSWFKYIRLPFGCVAQILIIHKPHKFGI